MIEYLGHMLVREEVYKNDNWYKCLCCNVLTYQHGPVGHFEYLYYCDKKWLELILTCEEMIIKKLLE